MQNCIYFKIEMYAFICRFIMCILFVICCYPTVIKAEDPALLQPLSVPTPIDSTHFQFDVSVDSVTHQLPEFEFNLTEFHQVSDEVIFDLIEKNLVDSTRYFRFFDGNMDNEAKNIKDNRNKIYYMMNQNATLTHPDSILIKITGLTTKSRKIDSNWYLNGDSVKAFSDTSYKYSVSATGSVRDTVVNIIAIAESDSLLIATWICEKRLRALKEIVKIFPATDDSLLLVADSASFGIQFDEHDFDTLVYEWSRNQQIIENSPGPVFNYRSLTIGHIDTIRLTIRKVDNTLIYNHNWIVYNTDIEQDVMSALPPETVFIEYGDSIQIAFDDDLLPDTVVYQWMRNSVKDTLSHNPTYLYRASEQGQQIDTIRVIDFANKTQLHTWIIVSYNGNEKVADMKTLTQPDSMKAILDSAAVYRADIFTAESDSVRDISTEDSTMNVVTTPDTTLDSLVFIDHFSPQHDTTIAIGDTLNLSVYANRDSCRFLWCINDSIHTEQHDSFFIYIAFPTKNELDTIDVFVSAQHSEIQQQITWIISKEDTITSQPPVFEFIPKIDTVGYQGEPLTFSINIQNPMHDSSGFSWFLNDSLIMSGDDYSYIFTNESNEYFFDTLRVAFTNPEDTLYCWSWFIESHVKQQNWIDHITRYPIADTSVTCGDSLRLSIELNKINLDSIAIKWTINDSVYGNDNDCCFTYIASDSTLVDTVAVYINCANEPEEYSTSWLLSKISPKNKLPAVLHYSPASDTSIAITDSVIFSLDAVDAENDSIIFQWFINKKLQINASDSVFTYHAFDKFQKVDTVKVRITDSQHDSVNQMQWLISKFSHSYILDSYTCSPVADTFISIRDSVRLQVFSDTSDIDSVKYFWFNNGKLVYDHDQAEYVYHADSSEATIDSIVVYVIDVINDTTTSFTWQLFKRALIDDFHLLGFFPERDTTINFGDSLSFETKLLAPPGEAINFHWFENDSLLTDATDSSFAYIADNLGRAFDSIRVVITNNDSVVELGWRITIPDYEDHIKYQPPVLSHPINGDAITENEYFRWCLDSIPGENAEQLKFVLEIATDTLFSQISLCDTIVMDTCIKCDDLREFDSIIPQEDYYWRLKILSETETKSSEFATCKSCFSYLPEFMEIVQFNGERNKEGHVLLSWETEYRSDYIGFNVYRSVSSVDHFEKINTNLIFGQKQYSYTDSEIKNGESVQYKLEQISKNGRRKMHSPLSVSVNFPENYSLFPNYPNPFNTFTLFRYQLPVKTQVSIDIYNVLGRKIRTLVNEQKEPGFYTINWDGLDNDGAPVVSGLYFYRMQAGTFRTTRKMTVVR